MRLAVVSDIHGNLPALDAVLDDIATSGVDLTVNLGDIVSGPLWPAETAALLIALGLPTIRGNHERQVLAPGPKGASDGYAAARLDARAQAWLASLPASLRLADGTVACCHGTPASDVEYFLETVCGGMDRAAGLPGVRAATADEAAARAGDLRAEVILCGHTHMPRAMRLADGRLVVNPGSVGLQAYDDDHGGVHVVETGTPHARYAVLTRRAAGWQVELRAVPYDHAAAAAQAEVNGRGDWADALLTGRMGRFEAEVVGR